MLSLALFSALLASLASPEGLSGGQGLAKILGWIQLSGFFGGEGKIPALAWQAQAFAFVAGLAGLSRIAVVWASTRLSAAMGTDISAAVYDRCLHLSYAEHLRRGAGEMMSLVRDKANDVNMVMFYLLTLSGNRMDYTGGTTVNAGTLTLGGMATAGSGRGTIRGTVTVNQGATLDYAGEHSFGWKANESVNVLNINGGTVGGADINNHFYGGGTFTLNMSGGELKLGGGDNPTDTMNFNVLSNNTTARVTAVAAASGLTVDTKATFNVADGSQDVDLLVSAAVTRRYSGKGQVFKVGAGTMRMTGTNNYEVGIWVQDGVLEIEHSRSLGSGAIAVEGGTLRYLGTGTDTSSRTFHLNGANGTFEIVNTNANLVSQ